jgi:hypothetical protein
MKNEQLDLKTTREVAELFRMSEISQWRARRAGELDFYRIGGKIMYSEKMLIDYAERRKNVTLRDSGQAA